MKESKFYKYIWDEDKKNFLLKKNLLPYIVERTNPTLSDKKVDVLYGVNAIHKYTKDSYVLVRNFAKRTYAQNWIEQTFEPEEKVKK